MQANSCDAQGGGADAAQPEMCQHPSPVSPNLGGTNLGFSLWTTRQGNLAKYSAVDLISPEVAPFVLYAVEWAEPVVESVMLFFDLSSISDSRSQRGVPPRSGMPYKQVLTGWSQRLAQQCGRQNLLMFPLSLSAIDHKTQSANQCTLANASTVNHSQLWCLSYFQSRWDWKGRQPWAAFCGFPVSRTSANMFGVHSKSKPHEKRT